MQAVILAGGKGLRLKSLISDLPKPMVELAGVPLLARIINWLKLNSVNDIILCTSYLSEIIEKNFGKGEDFGVNIRYYTDIHPLGTAGVLAEIEDLDEHFFVVYGDVYSEVDLSKMLKFHNEKNAIATLAVHESDHPEDSNLLELDGNRRVTVIHNKGQATDTKLTNAALYIFNKKILGYITKGKNADIASEILPILIEKGEHLYGYETDEFIKDIGTPERLNYVNDYLKDLKPAVFLDRDGVINEEVDFLCKPEQIKLINGAADGIKALNENGFLVIVVTNQPVVARNLCTEDDLKAIHKRLTYMLNEEGAKIDAIYYCPHHPQKWHKDGNPAYRLDCECRKPRIGMFKMALKHFNMDLNNSYMVGDTERDILAGKSAGCRTILVKTGYGKNYKSDVIPDHVLYTLQEACEFIIKQKR